MAQCPALTAAGEPCHNPIVECGVCRRHKMWAYDGADDPEVQRYIREYAALSRQFQEAWHQCNIRHLDPQRPYQGNLTQTLDPTTIGDPHLRAFVVVAEAQRQRITMAKHVMNPDLACNLAAGISSLILDPQGSRSPLVHLAAEYARPYVI
jgi:hypothetical protein